MPRRLCRTVDGPEALRVFGGAADYIIDRIGQFAEAGVDEIMFGAIPTGDVEALQRVYQEIVAALD